ncbi:hypothetical protein ABT033_31590 [Streptomyces pharetrae]|uniref:hypothetical protein n=1 Tax=Streptomyces pharetrae TaxID=291370 RepID=UPI00335AE8FA
MSFGLDEREQARQFATFFKEIEDRLAALERSNQLNHASIEGGSLDIYDEEGTFKGSIGVQPDGGVALVPDPENTEPPPTPTAPAVEPALAGLLIAWDGAWADAAEPPSDFALVQVHAGPSETFTPDVSTQVATITAPLGGSVTVHIEGYDVVWVRLVAQNTATLTGTPSAAVQGQPRQAVPQDLIDGIVTEVKLAHSAVTAAKIALGAVGTTALADGAVLAEKLAKNSVTQTALAAGSVTLNALGGPLGDSATQRYVDTFRDPAAWQQLAAANGGTWQISPEAVGTPSGGGVLTATGDVELAGKALITQDADTLYRVMVRVRATAQDSAGPATVYLGVAGVAEDGVTLVNRSGVAATTMHYYCASNGGVLATADGWRVYVGYIQGRAAAGTTAPAGPQTDPRQPGTTHANVRYLRPLLWLNFGRSRAAVMEVDAVVIEALRTGVVNSNNLLTGSVTAAALATDSVIAGKIAADAVTAREIAANSVTAAEIAAGAITAEKLTVVGGANLLSDPSFEGAYSAGLVANSQFFSVDAIGNGSAKSLKINAAAASATTRSLRITTIPILAGDQLYLAAEYLTSSDYTPTAVVKIYARWEDSAGATLGWGVAQASPPTIGGTAWTRIWANHTAPAGTVQASIWVESLQATAGAVWLDNMAVRPVLPGVQIADGAITAPKILTGAITTDHLTALAVTAEKIAALAVTADKIAALAVTADKLAANSVTASKILAGSIDATHIKAGAISADRLALGTDGNVIADPSFEGATSDQRIAGNPDWTFVPGNGTARALQVNSVSTTPVNRTLVIATLPAIPGQKVWLSFDYLASADWAGSTFGLYGQWFNAAGTLLAYSSLTLDSATAVKGAWTTASGIPTAAAPTGTTQLRIVLGVVGGTTGTVQFDNTACRIVMASGFAGARAEISPSGLQLYDDTGEEAVALLTGRPNYLTLSADGVPVATIDQEGKAGFQSLSIAEGLTVGGDDIAAILDQRPRGIIAYGVPTTTVTSTGTEIGLFELPATIEAGRMYRVKFHATADFDNANDGIARINLRDGGTARPTITSTLRQQAMVNPSHTGNFFTAELEHIAPASTLGAGLHRFLISFYNDGGTTGQTFELGLPTTGRSCYFLVEDIGPEIPKTGVYNTGGGTAEPPVQQYTKTYNATWSGSYANRGSYNSHFGNSCYQGYYSSTNGMQASLIGFSSSLATDLSGATIQKAEVYLYYDHWYNNAGGTAVIKAHKHTSRPSTFSCDAESKSVSWGKNVGKWVDITSVFDSTTWRGIALDPNTSGLTYYGRARGYGQTNPPKLRVTFTK